MADETKITFVGDMLCGRPTLEEFAVADGWDFKPVFAGVRDFLGDSDYVVGNLETPITLDGDDLTHERWCFNSPAQFAEAVKWAGVDFVTTANNHCLDRGTRGIVSTIRALDAVGLRHTGTFADRESAVAPNIVEIGGFRLGFLSYTYGTNAFSNHEYLKPEETFMVNLFQEQELAEPLARKWMWERESPEAKIYEEMERKRWPENLMLPVYERVAAHEVQRAHLADDVRRLRTPSPDFTVMGMHTGGQYNDVASRWTKELADFIHGCGVDIVYGTHEHVVHGGDFSRIGENRLTTYCLGDFASQHGVIQPPDAIGKYPQYSVAWHLYLARDAQGCARISRTSFSVMLARPGNPPRRIGVVPACEAWRKEGDATVRDRLADEIRAVARRFTGRPCEDLAIAPEYFLAPDGTPSA